MSDPLRVKGTLDKGAGAGEVSTLVFHWPADVGGDFGFLFVGFRD